VKVSELIEQLQKCHPDDDVRMSIDAGELPLERTWAALIGITEVTSDRLGEIVLLGESD
jgi:hypothetical protein